MIWRFFVLVLLCLSLAILLQTGCAPATLSIDEAFLDLSGTERLHHASPALTLIRLATRIEQEIGITISVGLSYCKFLAKMASDLDKPRGFAIIGIPFMALVMDPIAFAWGPDGKFWVVEMGDYPLGVPPQPPLAKGGKRGVGVRGASGPLLVR